jgi:hypothetical protein
MLLHLILSNTLTAITFLLLGVSLDPEFRALAVDWRYRQIDTNIYATGRLIASISDEAVSAIRCLASRSSCGLILRLVFRLQTNLTIR